jgi:hypothetical protein
MKTKVLVFICTLLFFVPVFAQEEITIREDSLINEKIDPDSIKSSVSVNGASTNLQVAWGRQTLSHWTGLGIDFPRLSGPDAVKLNPWKSYGLYVDFFQISYALNSHWVIGEGFGIGFNQYRFKDMIALKMEDGKTKFVLSDENVEYQSSQLVYGFLKMSLFVEYQTKFKKSNTFFISAGIEPLLPFYSSRLDVKEVTSSGTDLYSYFPLNFEPAPYRLALTVGINKVAIFAYHQPYSIFQEGKGPDIRTWGIGIKLTPTYDSRMLSNKANRRLFVGL